MYTWATAGALALGCAITLYIGRALGNRVPHPLPPGPPGLPWIGNVIGIDASAPWKTYAEWARTYGDIIYSRLFGKDIVIVNSEKVAKELLENRSSNYSDRPYLITAEMCGLDFHSPFLPYGNRWRLHRRFFHQAFRLDAVSRFHVLQHRKACQFLRHLLDTPQQLDGHVFRYTASIILNCTYDYDPAPSKDELVDMLEDALTIMVASLRPDIPIVAGAFPLLLHLPSWFPGMSFKSQMEKARIFCKQYLERPFQHALQRAADGTIAPSMVHDALRHMEEKGITPEYSWMKALKESSGSSFLAASDTSHSALMTFFLAMVLNPAAQEKAQVQIDTVVGRARLPTIDDRPMLPFVDAILREVLRYNPVTPLSVPHAAIEDDVYEGFHIPRGAVVLVNLWSMAHDEFRFPNAHAFIPERFLDDDGSLKPNEIEHIAFGFGRRICVGRHFADASVWSVIAKVLAVFKILRPLDENGIEIPVVPKFSSGLSTRPLPFGYRIVPRFPEMDTEKLERLIVASIA